MDRIPHSRAEQAALAVRNMDRQAKIDEAGLTINEVLGASRYLTETRLAEIHEFSDALDFARSVKSKLPSYDLSEVFEAGRLAHETGFHDNPAVSDALDFAKRIYCHVRVGQ